jgi:hypothetical protein
MELFAEQKRAFELYFLIISSLVVLLCFRTTRPMVAVERRGRVVNSLLRIREVPGSNLDPKTGYPD